MPRIFLVLLMGPLLSMIGGKKIGVLMHKPNKGLALVNEFFDAGKVAPVIDRSYPLSEVPEALRYFGEGSHQGKIVITM